MNKKPFDTGKDTRWLATWLLPSRHHTLQKINALRQVRGDTGTLLSKELPEPVGDLILILDISYCYCTIMIKLLFTFLRC